jgi:divalent metal cation (Fe/Co/Zn/Cd) transporter
MDAFGQVTGVRRGIAVEWVSIGWMVVEGTVAIGAGLAASSLVLTAFGVDSVIELVAGAVLLWRLAVEARGAPLAQVEQAERRASGVVGAALLALALYVVVMAGYDVWTRTGSGTSLPGLALAVASGMVMPYLARAKKRVGTQIGSPALRADGSCSMVCAYMAWTVVAGLVVQMAFGWWWLNAVAGLALAYFITTEGLESLGEARATAEEDREAD